MDDDAPDRIAHQLIRLLRILSRMRQNSDIAVATVLIQLLSKGPQRVGEIAHALSNDPSTVSRKIAMLVESGLVERRVDPDDGRAHLLAATESGARRFADDKRRRLELVAEVLSEWPDDAQHQLATLLARFVDDLDAHAEPEGDRRTHRRSGGEI